MKFKRLQSEKGFTIVELMIALSVLSTILVIATSVLIQIGSLYTKGVNAANLQNTTSNVMTDISSAIQFSGSSPFPTLPCSPVAVTCYAGPSSPTGPYAYCIGTIRYTYIFNREKGTDNSKPQADSTRETPHVLWRDTMAASSSCPPVDLATPGIPNDPITGTPTQGYDVVPNHMRLTRFKVIQNPDGGRSYDVDVWLAYGDDDLVSTDATGHSVCNGVIGTQFCGIAELTNSVTRRLEN